MNLKKTGVITLVLEVINKLKSKWLVAVIATLMVSFLIAMVTGILEFAPYFSIPFVGFILIGLIDFMRKLLEGKDYKLEDLFSDYKLFVTAFLTTALLLILISVGFALLIIPGILVLLNYSFTLHVLQENKQVGALEALSRSKKLSSGFKFKIGMFYALFLALSVISMGVSLLIMLIPNLIWGINVLLYAAILTAVIDLLFITPLFIASITMFYDELKAESEKRQKEFNDNEQEDEDKEEDKDEDKETDVEVEQV
jgi:uncharacterized membrane protein